MHWEKEIRIRITLRRIVGTIVAASTVANLIIVGAVFGADAPPAPTITSVLTTSLSTPTLFIPVSGGGETATFAPTYPPGATPADPFDPTQTPLDVPGWILCIKKFYWLSYRVQPGDTLFSLALATGSTVQELISANCLANHQIYAGQLLYVPRFLINVSTPTPTATATPSPTGAISQALTATQTPTATSTPTNTDTPSATASPSQTLTDTPTQTVTFSQTPTNTATETSSATPTTTPTASATPTPTNTLYIIGTVPGITQTVVLVPK